MDIFSTQEADKYVFTPPSPRNKIMEQYKAGEIDILGCHRCSCPRHRRQRHPGCFQLRHPAGKRRLSAPHRQDRSCQKEGISFVLHSKDEQKRLDNIIHYTRSHIIIALEMDGWGVFAPKKIGNNEEEGIEMELLTTERLVLLQFYRGGLGKLAGLPQR